MKRIKFQGKDFILVGEENGPICTQEQYENFQCSYAYLSLSGEILRFGEVIGHKEDIEFLGDIPENEEIEMGKKGLKSLGKMEGLPPFEILKKFIG